MIDILVVSHACVTAINRLPYARLAALGWSVEIATAVELKDAEISRRADPPRPGDPPMHYLPLTGVNARLWHFVGLRELIARLRPRIILADYDPGSRVVLEVGLFTAGRDVKIAAVTYDNILRSIPLEFRRSPGAGLRAAGALALAQLARPVVDHVWVLSKDSEAVMRQLGFGNRVSRIPLGFDPVQFRPDPVARARVRAQLGLRETTFAYFGRVVPDKGAHLLVEALHKLRGRPWQLLLDRFSEYAHPYARELSNLIARLGLTDRVVYFDANHDEIAQYINAADVVVMPSQTSPRFKEQYGRVAAEAMACGRLVMVSDCGALPELVADAGIVIRQDELSHLDRYLALVLDDPSLPAQYAERARRRAMDNLSVDVQAAKMNEVFSRWASK